jgi:hypothetical protein
MLPEHAQKVKWIEVYMDDPTKADRYIKDNRYRIEHHDDVKWWIEDEHLCIGGLCKNTVRYPDIAYDKFVTRE